MFQDRKIEIQAQEKPLTTGATRIISKLLVRHMNDITGTDKGSEEGTDEPQVLKPDNNNNNNNNHKIRAIFPISTNTRNFMAIYYMLV
jgi:hypothetical protein